MVKHGQKGGEIMDPITLAAVMGGAGLLKSELIDKPREQEQRRQAAITARWSPWTGMAPGAIQTANPFGSALEGAITGSVLAQNLNLTGGKEAATKDLAEAATIQPEAINLTAQGPSDLQQIMMQDELKKQQMQSMLSPAQRQSTIAYPFLGMRS